MKGILLAGGSGSRLYPVTRAVSKQLLPVYDKPLIYYPLSVLMLAGIREILIITTPDDQAGFQRLLGDGKNLGMRFEYAIQEKPAGIAQAITIAKDFTKGEAVALILGDNIFYGQGLPKLLRNAIQNHRNATVFGYSVSDPERYGVLAMDAQGSPTDILEKPANPPSNIAVTGLYLYDSSVYDIVASLKPSARGEYEITDVNKAYLQKGLLQVERFGRGFAWLDTGTHESLLGASNFIETIQQRQGMKIACLEEIAFRQGYLSAEALLNLAEPLKQNEYGMYLIQLAESSLKNR